MLTNFNFSEKPPPEMVSVNELQSIGVRNLKICLPRRGKILIAVGETHG
jgi:hypothetical protein